MGIDAEESPEQAPRPGNTQQRPKTMRDRNRRREVGDRNRHRKDVIIAALARILDFLGMIPTKRGNQGLIKVIRNQNYMATNEPGTWQNQVQQHRGTRANRTTEPTGGATGVGARDGQKSPCETCELKAAREKPNFGGTMITG
jgi:hypothetical protein